MTTEERDYIDDKFNSLGELIGDIAKEVHTIKRGVYGDPDNKVPGLIDTDREQHNRIKSLEETRKRAIYWGGGFLAGLEGIWHWITAK